MCIRDRSVVADSSPIPELTDTDTSSEDSNYWESDQELERMMEITTEVRNCNPAEKNSQPKSTKRQLRLIPKNGSEQVKLMEKNKTDKKKLKNQTLNRVFIGFNTPTTCMPFDLLLSLNYKCMKTPAKQIP